MQLDCFCRLDRIPHIRVAMEVCVHGGSCDLVILSGGKSYGIELKLSCNKMVIAQATKNQMAFDFAYICTPVIKPPAGFLTQLEKRGLGYLEYCLFGPSPFKQILPAKRNYPLEYLARLLPERFEFSREHVLALKEKEEQCRS